MHNIFKCMLLQECASAQSCGKDSLLPYMYGSHEVASSVNALVQIVQPNLTKLLLCKILVAETFLK